VKADSGKVVWKYDSDTSMVASVIPTAGGIVLRGDSKANFLVFDGADGGVLLKRISRNGGGRGGSGSVDFQLAGSFPS
jgi:hypothetical protein